MKQALSRRSILKALATLPLLPALVVEERLPILHGDGVSDDTEALQALLDGKPVRCARDGRIVMAVRDEVTLPPGNYSVGNLDFRGRRLMS